MDKARVCPGPVVNLGLLCLLCADCPQPLRAFAIEPTPSEDKREEVYCRPHNSWDSESLFQNILGRILLWEEILILELMHLVRACARTILVLASRVLPIQSQAVPEL